MVKAVVLYGTPEDPDAFECNYAETHRALAKAIPDLERFEGAQGIATRTAAQARAPRAKEQRSPDWRPEASACHACDALRTACDHVLAQTSCDERHADGGGARRPDSGLLTECGSVGNGATAGTARMLLPRLPPVREPDLAHSWADLD